MSEQQASYRQIMKATSIFGGVQVFQIIIQIIRSKFVAIYLGPAGMGLLSLFTTTISLISGLSNFGLGTSAVKNVAEANGTGNNGRIATIVIVLRRLVWITGLLGAILTIIFSTWLSQFTFGSKEYTLAFVWISVTLLFNQLSSGQMVVLQGMRKIKSLAKANLWGGIIGLFITIPLYYKLGVKGIVPVIILSSAINLLVTWYFSSKIKIEKCRVGKIRTIAESKSMLILGFMINIGNLFSLGASYLVRIFINHNGYMEDVGLYNAGFAIINTYVGMIFTAMATDYYPKLSSVAKDNDLSIHTINQQAEITILILAPVLLVFLVFINWVVILLYSTKFIYISSMIYWASIGMFFKAISWAIAFIFLAKGKSKLYFWNELIANIYFVIFNLIGYYFYGLTGLGISFLFSYLVYMVQVFIIAKLKFNFRFNDEFIKLFVKQFTLAIICLILVLNLQKPQIYIFGIMLIVFSFFYSIKELDKKLDLRKYLKKNI